jgi:hypothetical protein
MVRERLLRIMSATSAFRLGRCTSTVAHPWWPRQWDSDAVNSIVS